MKDGVVEALDWCLQQIAKRLHVKGTIRSKDPADTYRYVVYEVDIRFDLYDK